MKKIVLILSLLMTVLSAAPYQILSPSAVKNMLDSGENFVLIDALTPIHYAMEHIPDAVNIPEGMLVDNGGNLNKNLPDNKATRIVFYCMDPKCIFSKNNAAEAIQLGYTNVFVMEAGIKGWKTAGYLVKKGTIKLPAFIPESISPQELQKNIKKYQLVNLLSDVKGMEYIDGSINAPITDFIYVHKRISKRKPVVLYSLHGKVDKLAARYLVVMGYKQKNIKFLKGGITAWKAAGFNTETR